MVFFLGLPRRAATRRMVRLGRLYGVDGVAWGFHERRHCAPHRFYARLQSAGRHLTGLGGPTGWGLDVVCRRESPEIGQRRSRRARRSRKRAYRSQCMRPRRVRVCGASASAQRPLPRSIRVSQASASVKRPRPHRARICGAFASAGRPHLRGVRICGVYASVGVSASVECPHPPSVRARAASAPVQCQHLLRVSVCPVSTFGECLHPRRVRRASSVNPAVVHLFPNSFGEHFRDPSSLTPVASASGMKLLRVGKNTLKPRTGFMRG